MSIIEGGGLSKVACLPLATHQKDLNSVPLPKQPVWWSSTRRVSNTTIWHQKMDVHEDARASQQGWCFENLCRQVIHVQPLLHGCYCYDLLVLGTCVTIHVVLHSYLPAHLSFFLHNSLKQRTEKRSLLALPIQVPRSSMSPSLVGSRPRVSPNEWNKEGWNGAKVSMPVWPNLKTSRNLRTTNDTLGCCQISEHCTIKHRGNLILPPVVTFIHSNFIHTACLSTFYRYGC